jgi:hypothetical protein
MFLLYVVVTSLTALTNAAFAVADLVRARFVLQNSAEVGVSASWLPLLGILKGLGAAGLLVGLFGSHLIGVAAGIGLVLFFVGAVAVHVRAHVFYNIAFPGTCLAMAVASLGLAVLR